MSRFLRLAARIAIVGALAGLAGCAPTSTAGNSPASSSPATLGSSGSSPQSDRGPSLSNNAPVSQAESDALTSHLHQSQLPLVGARVLASNGGPRQVILYGFVAT